MNARQRKRRRDGDKWRRLGYAVRKALVKPGALEKLIAAVLGRLPKTPAVKG